MSTSRILYSQTTQLGKQVAQAVNAALEARSQVSRVLPILNAASYGSDWAALALELGLVGPTAATDAQNLWTLVSTADGHTNHAAIAELSRLDQG